MAILKVQRWLPDTHPGHVVEIEWEYDPEAGRDTGRDHRGISVRYPDGTVVHADTHGADVAHQHYKNLHAEHVVKNQAYAVIVESLPARMKKPLLNDRGEAVFDRAGRPVLVLVDVHRPCFRHLGKGRYEFTVPGIDEGTHRELAEKLAHFGDRVILLNCSKAQP